MEFNPDPSKQATEVLFSCKKVSPSHPHVTFNGTVIKKVNEQKHLGLILDSDLSFKKHLDEKIIITVNKGRCEIMTKWDAIINIVFNQGLKQVFYIFTNNCRQSF